MKNFRLKALVAAIGFATLASTGAATAATTAHHGFAEGVVAQATTLRKGDIMVGPLAQSAPMHITVALKMRNRGQLDTFINATHSTAGIMARKVLSHDQFQAQYAPSTTAINSVVRYLRRAGFTNVKVSSSGMLVSADATSGVVGSTFNTSFAHVLTADGRSAHMNTRAVTLPKALRGSVLSVLGLQDVHRGHTVARKAPRGINATALIGHYPVEFSSIYGGDGMPDASGVTVGIFTAGDVSHSLADLETFTTVFELDPVVTEVVKTNGGGTDLSGTSEWNLDSQDIVGMAGGKVGKLIFYTAPSLSYADMLANFDTIVNANATKIINVSIGGCELYAQATGAAAVSNQLFQQAVAQGQTFSISTGDEGADECGNGGTSASWPANSPYVVAVGGTTLDTTNYTTWNNELAWTYGGGASSTYETKPSWQQGVAPGITRGLPDVSYDADANTGAIIIVDGAWEQWGGTSLAAPLFAGTWARVLAAKGEDIGFAAPLLYQLPASAFHDVVTGDNGGSTAGPGYDLATGRGSLIISAALANIGEGSEGGGGTDNGLHNGVAASNIGARTGQDVSFTVNVPEGATNLVIESNNGTGNADLYVRAGSAPTLTTYDCRSNQRGNQESCSFDAPAAGTYYVTLHGKRTFRGVTLKASWTTTDEGGGSGESQTFSNNQTKAIPDNGMVESAIDVTGQETATSASVTINITHPYGGDLDVRLYLPGHQYAYQLKTPDGGDSTPNYHRTIGLNINGLPTPIDGTWTLRVTDAHTGDVGTLDSWSMQFDGATQEGDD